MVTDIAISAGKVCEWSAPSRGIRRGGGGDVDWDAVATEEPHTNASRTQLHGVNTTTVSVHEGAIRVRRSFDATAGILVSTVVAVCGCNGAGLFTLDLHAATFCGMQGHLISGGGVIDSLYNVDLAIVWPI